MSIFAQIKWIYILDKNETWNIKKYLPLDFSKNLAFEDRQGNRRLEIRANGDAIVMANYAWDGCTPKLALLDIMFGTPDGIPNPKTKMPKTYYASLFHDVFYQFIEVGLPLNRQQIDHIFLDILTHHEFAPRKLYFYAVRLFGNVFRQWTKRKRRYAGKRVTL